MVSKARRLGGYRLAQSVSIRDDLELRPAEPYTPTGELSDDYRCFLIDPAIEGERFFTGYQLVPGNLNIVHHIILFGITEAGRVAADAKDAEDTADGWPCFGDIGLPGVESSVGVSWTPGEGAVKFPEGTGVPVNGDTLFVLQVRHNLAAGVGTDHSSARLELSEPGTELTPLVSLDLLAPVELPCPAGEQSEACSREHALGDAEQFDPEARTFNDALLVLCDRHPADYARQDPRNVTSSCDWHCPSAVTRSPSTPTCTRWGSASELTSTPTQHARACFSTSRTGTSTGRAPTPSRSP